jgi:tetratricopeptide (TPR) repeat protein
MTDPLHNSIDNVATVLLQAARSKSTDQLLIVSIESVLRKAKPRQAEIMRRCAVPRWFDLSVLAVLRENADGNERVLEELADYSFVRDLGDGRFAYHDTVRAMLLNEWRETRPDDLRALHLQLHAYFSRRTTPPGSARRAQPTVIGATMLVNVMPGNPQSDLFRREALYHLLCAEPQRGLTELRSAWDEVEESYRLADAEALLQVAAEVPSSAELQGWLNYMRGRASQLALNLSHADAQFSALLDQPDLDQELAARASRALGEVRAETGQWADATDRHRYSLAYFQRIGDTRAAADTMMLLGEAYQGLGVSTGSWQVAVQSRNSLFAFVGSLWNWLLALPFVLIGLVLGRGNHALPQPRYCARYQNWLLIRLYNTARSWYRQALSIYETLKDERGILRAEQRLADILTLYGYPQEAIIRIEKLLTLPTASDPYRRAWLDRSLADAYLAIGDARRAQELLKRASLVFNELGDVRRAAALLDLQGRAALQAGDHTAALGSFAASLTRFRALNYGAARERILHALRIWRRDPTIDASVTARIDAMIRAEPEKRYVGRFIRSATPILQVASVLAIPLGLLLASIVVPTLSVNVLNGGVFSVRTFYDPLRFLSVVLTLIPFFLAAYTALALVVIFLLPTARIEREQPHQIVTTPEAITRYDQRGAQMMTMAWRDIRRWLSLDRCVWDQPLPLYSRSFLEDEAGRDLEIDGITGWYSDLKDDIAQRLTSSGNQVAQIDLGYRLLKSSGGVAVILGIILLLLFTWTINGWLPFPYLLPPPVFAVLHMLTFSGALILTPIAYWVAYRPLKLQRTLQLSERYPLVIAAIGALAVGLYIIGGGRALPVPMLNISTLIWGIYMLGEGLTAWFFPQRAVWRRILLLALTAAALAATLQPLTTIYHQAVGAASTAIVNSNSVEAPAGTAQSGYDAFGEARDSGGDPFSTFIEQGNIAASSRQPLSNERSNDEIAIENYLRALEVAPPGSPQQALAYYNIAQILDRNGLTDEAQRAYDEYWRICNDVATRQTPLCIQMVANDSLANLRGR